MKMRRLAGLFLWRMGGEPSSRANEARAQITCYPTHTRRTYAAPQKRPGGAENTPGPTGRTVSDDEKYDA